MKTTKIIRIRIKCHTLQNINRNKKKTLSEWESDPLSK